MYELAKAHFSYIWESLENAGNANERRCDGDLLRVVSLDEIAQRLNRRLGKRDRRINPAGKKYTGVERRRSGTSDRRYRKAS